MAIRVQGKAGSPSCSRRASAIQIYVRKDNVGEDGFALYKLLDLGDHIGASGFLFRTRTGELTVHVDRTDLPGEGHARRCRTNSTAWKTPNCAIASAMST